LLILYVGAGRFRWVSLQKPQRIITMAAPMNNTQETNNPGYDKIALLGLFMLSLLLANSIVFFKARISFSDPIRLSKTGLSVSMPSGHNWQSEKDRPPGPIADIC
jgi:hypothetical protein